MKTLRANERPCCALGRLQVGGRESRVPVVRVDDLRRPCRIEMLRELRGDPAEQREALRVVAVGHVLVVSDRDCRAGRTACRRGSHRRSRPFDGSVPCSSVTPGESKRRPSCATGRRSVRPATTAGKPGSSTRTSAPRSISAGGNAPATSARPPVLRRGYSSLATCRARIVIGSVSFLLVRVCGRSAAVCAGGKTGGRLLASPFVSPPRRRLRPLLPQRVGRDQHDAVVGAIEALGVRAPDLRRSPCRPESCSRGRSPPCCSRQLAPTVTCGNKTASLMLQNEFTLHVRRQHRARNLRTRDHAAAAHDQVVAGALQPFQVAHELGRAATVRWYVQIGQLRSYRSSVGMVEARSRLAAQ